jgi:hypothetical protein
MSRSGWLQADSVVLLSIMSSQAAPAVQSGGPDAILPMSASLERKKAKCSFFLVNEAMVQQ